MKQAYFILIALVTLTGSTNAQNQQRETNINSIFEKMELQGVDTKKALLYGFFFYSKSKSNLEKLKDALIRESYKLVRLEEVEDNNFMLHVDKIEVHSRASLLKRENQLDGLAQKFQVTYDGWDVGNADPTKPLVSEGGFEKSLDSKTGIELYRFATNLYDNEIYDKAIIAFQKCIELNYRKDTCYYKQGVSHLTTGQAKEGVKKLEACLKINPKYFKACFNIGAACYFSQEYEKSITYYQKAAKLDPKNDSVYYGIAASQFVLGQFKNAEVNCQAALKLNPANKDATALLAQIKKKNN